MTAYRRFAFWSVLWTYVVIFAGGLVRVSGAGLGCPDWPRCFGRWFPPLSAGDLPADINPTTFNFALAWIEYTNRLVGMLLGLLIVIAAVLAIVQYRHVKRILWPSIAAALLVAFQGWQGGQVVLSELAPVAVSLHLIIALIILSLLTYTTQRAYYLEEAKFDLIRSYPKSLALWIGALWSLAIVQVVVGSGIRGAIEELITRFPLANDHELLNMVGGVKYLHTLLGIGIAVITLVVGLQIYRSAQQPEQLVRLTVWWLIILVAAQMSLGTGLVAVALPPLLQLFHVWTATLYIGAVLVLYTAVKRTV